MMRQNPGEKEGRGHGGKAKVEGGKRRKMTNAESDKDVLYFPFLSFLSHLFAHLLPRYLLPPSTSSFLNFRFCYLSMVRTTDQEMIDTKEIVCHAQFPRELLYYDMQGHIGNTRVGQEAE